MVKVKKNESASADYKYVRVTATVSGSYRNRGIGVNLATIQDVANMFQNLANADLSNVYAIRVKPTEVCISSADSAADFLKNARGRSW